MPGNCPRVSGPAGTQPGPRLLAARLVHGVAQQGSSLANLPAVLSGESDDPRQRALAQELAYGTLRWYHRLDTLLGYLLTRPLKTRDRDIHALLLVGLYQLLILDMAAHAAVSETVEAVRVLGKDWASGLVNGVLRNALRRREALLKRADAQPVARWSHPQWWLERVRRDWPEDWQAILEANNRRPPMTLRINRRRGDRDSYQARLLAAGMEARPLPCCPTALELATPAAVDRLPGFVDGDASVQDGAAQLCALLLELGDGQRVLDACAAPGGKTGHILESAARLDEVVAIDSDPRRLQKVRDNLQRLQLRATCLAADAGDPQAWWDGRYFDRILLDAPCSASGVVRRHPDIKLLRRAEDLPELARQQQRLLEALWPLLRSGGILLYVTCSVFRQENSEVVQGFLAGQPDARVLPLDVQWGRPVDGGRQLLPGEHGMDGFYFARLVKA
jgi:16S rRNA (cytosine967-C5)-methyltransferase